MSNTPIEKKESKTLTEIIPPWIGAIATVITIIFLIQDKCITSDSLEKESPPIIVYNPPVLPKDEVVKTSPVQEAPKIPTTKETIIIKEESSKNQSKSIRLILSRKLNPKDQLLLNDEVTPLLSNYPNVKQIMVPTLNKTYAVKLIMAGDTLICSTIYPEKDNELIPLACDN